MATTIRASDEIFVLDLPQRVYNALHRNGIATVGELCRVSEVEFLCFRNVGEGALRELRQTLAAHGLSMPADPPPPPDPALAAEAEWIGRQLDALSEDTRARPSTGLLSSEQPSQVRLRRYAWEMYRWAVNGFDPSEWPAKGEKGYGWNTVAMPGSMELHLEGLNRLAHQELDA